MRKSIWLAVGASAGVIAAAGLAPFLTHQEGLAVQDLWSKIQPTHLLWAAVVFGAAGAVPLLAPTAPFRRLRARLRLRQRSAPSSRARSPEQRLVRIARRKGLSQDAVRILLWRERERPARRRPNQSIRGTSFRPAKTSAAFEPKERAPRQERSTWVRVA